MNQIYQRSPLLVVLTLVGLALSPASQQSSDGCSCAASTSMVAHPALPPFVLRVSMTLKASTPGKCLLPGTPEDSPVCGTAKDCSFTFVLSILHKGDGVAAGFYAESGDIELDFPNEISKYRAGE